MDQRRYFGAIYDVVKQIPAGKVMSYGQVGEEAHAGPRTVGWAMANAAADETVPWQRVVGADGYLRIGKRSVSLMQLQRKMLEREGVTFLENGCVDMSRHQVGSADAVADSPHEHSDGGLVWRSGGS